MGSCLNTEKGFTLFELLIVVIIVGILATVALPQYSKVIEKSKFTQAITKLNAIRTAEKVYYAEHGFYDDFNWLAAPGTTIWDNHGVYPSYFAPEVSGDYRFTYQCEDTSSQVEYRIPPGASQYHWAAWAYRRIDDGTNDPGQAGYGASYLLMDLETGKLYIKFDGEAIKEY